jgi:hypothetical protein
MKEKYGIIFVDQNTIIVRIYETNELEWRLIYYVNKPLPISNPAEQDTGIYAEAIADLLSTPELQHIAEWRVFTRSIAPTIVSDLRTATGLKIEALTPLREQELLCKGMFTEFW